MTEKQASALTAHLATFYDVPAWTPERLKAFAQAIVDLDYEVAKVAVLKWVRTEHGRPQPSDIRKVAVSDALALPGPEEAWEELHYQIQSNREPPARWSHPAIAEAFRLTGRSWEEVRLLQYDKYPWLRRDFLSAYHEVSDKLQSGTQAEQGLRFPSRSEARSLLTELHAALPKRIGT